MIAPRLSIRFRDRELAITQLGEAWAIEVEGAQYFLSAGVDPMRQARRFVGGLPKNTSYPLVPLFVATQSFPLLLELDGTLVQAWPTYLPRNDPPRTFENPHWGHRVIATQKHPVWLFASRGRSSGPSGRASSAQTVADVAQLARAWLLDDQGEPEQR